MARPYGKLVKLLIRWAVSLALMGYLFTLVNWSQMRAVFASVGVTEYLVSTLFFLATQVLMATRLNVLMKQMPQRLPVLRLWRIEMISRFYGFFLPAGIGVNIARWYKVTENKQGRLQFVMVTAIEKAMFVLATAAIGGTALGLTSDPRVDSIRPGALLFFALCAVAVIAFFAVLFFRPGLDFALAQAQRFNDRVSGVADAVSAAAEKARAFCANPGNLFAVLFLSALIQTVRIIRIGVLFLAVGVNLSWADILWIGTLVFIVQSVPISFAGLGVRESAFVFLFSLFELGAELGTAVGLLFFSQIFLYALTGGLLAATDRGNAPPTEAAPESA